MTLARPYAVAAFERAKETGSVEQWQETLDFLRELIKDPLMQQAAANPTADKQGFLNALLDVCGDRVFGDTANFLRLLVQNRRLGLIEHIASLFSYYRSEDEGTIDADVETAYPLNDEQCGRIAALIEKLLNRRARLTVRSDRDLIGGVIIRAGDRVIDASLRGQLQRLQKSLSN